MMRNSMWAELLRRYLVNMSRARKSTLTVAVDSVGFALCCIAAFWVLRVDVAEIVAIVTISAVTIIAAISHAWIRGLYRSVVRFMGVDLFLTAAKISVIAGIFGTIATQLLLANSDALRWGLAFTALSLIYVTGSRYLSRLFLLRRQPRNLERIAIYGAGAAGAQLVSSLRSSDEFQPIVIIDDDVQMSGKRVGGLEVYNAADVEHVIKEHEIERVLLAMPATSRRRRRQVLERLSEFSVHVQTIPGISEVVSGRARVDDISDVDIEDLLGRDSVPPDPQLLSASITGKSVLVTGAGGSIGSELCRQILALNPSCLVLFDIAEESLYNIGRELDKRQRQDGTSVDVVSLLGSVCDESRVREIIGNFEVQTIYHAAAYKHVPIVEHNLFAGVQNNIFGTLYTARAAMDSGIETFVLISTDKAVNPTNIMGATKRVAELILQAFNSKQPKTKFCMVRFGNVLGSSGSVVPLFREQIRSGGPVTVTHRDIIRYFMTIPEAAQLVIQASTLAKGGEVLVLDMGKPVKIKDLAQRMISLMGLTVSSEDHPDGDIAIEYIGLRPAEKLFEELLIGSKVEGTEHPRIMTADEDALPYNELSTFIDQLSDAVTGLDYETARQLLIDVVKEYAPPNGIDDLAWNKANNKTDSTTETDTVVNFPTGRS